MAQVIAITEIVRNIKPGIPGDKEKGIKATPPVSKTIQPGTLFVSEGEELATLRKARAVRDPEAADMQARQRPVTDDEPYEAPKPAKAASKAPAKKAPAKDPLKTGGADNGGSGNENDGSGLV